MQNHVHSDCYGPFFELLQAPDASSRFSTEMLTRARLADEARALAEAQASKQAEAKRACMLRRLERERKLRTERVHAEQQAIMAGVRAGRLTVSLAEAVFGPPPSSVQDNTVVLDEDFAGSQGRFYVTVLLESLELLSEVADGPDPVFQDLFTIPVLQSTELLLQVCLRPIEKRNSL
jgi:hypothetical protein